MSYDDALTVLYAGVRDAATSADTPPPCPLQVVFGRREPAKSTNQGQERAGRVVFAPGDETGRLVARYGNPKQSAGLNPRRVRNAVVLARVFVWARDASAPRDELAQYRAVRLLHEWVVARIHNMSRGNSRLGPARDALGQPSDLAMFGSEMVIDLQLDVPIFDAPHPEIPAADAKASVTGVLAPSLAALEAGEGSEACTHEVEAEE